MSSSIGVLGLGSWGTALAHHLALRGHDVLAWGRDNEVVTEINERHLNPNYLRGVRLHAKLRATVKLEEASCRDVLLLAFPSSQLRNLLSRITVSKETFVISAIKGFEQESLTTPTAFAREVNCGGRAQAVLSGPSFARDIAEGRPCGVVLASAFEADATFGAELFASDTMRVFTSTDVIGVELGGATKNVIALAAGACDGLGLGESARAGLITRGLAEMMRLADAMGADTKSLAGLSGLGDLIMTCTSGQSRNYQVGFRLGRGERLKDILTSLGSVAEGVVTTAAVRKLAQIYKVRVTITDHVAMVLDSGADPKEMIASLINRPVKKEFE